MRNIDKVRAKSTVHRIYELFENDGRAIRKIPAIDALSQLKGSHVTIIKARHMLGVESKKIAGKWVWFYPKFSLEKALGKEKKIIYICMGPCIDEPGKVRFDLPAGTRKLRCPYCGGKNIRLTKAWNKEAEALERTLRFGHYDVESKKVVHALRRYLKSKIYSAMNDHPDTYRYRAADGTWHWCLVAQEIVDWLENTMCTHAGQIKERELLSMALKDKGWKSDTLLLKARIKLSSISTVYIKGVAYWRDSNFYRGNVRPDKSLPKPTSPERPYFVDEKSGPKPSGKIKKPVQIEGLEVIL